MASVFEYLQDFFLALFSRNPEEAEKRRALRTLAEKLRLVQPPLYRRSGGPAPARLRLQPAAAFLPARPPGRAVQQDALRRGRPAGGALPAAPGRGPAARGAGRPPAGVRPAVPAAAGPGLRQPHQGAGQDRPGVRAAPGRLLRAGVLQLRPGLHGHGPPGQPLPARPARAVQPVRAGFRPGPEGPQAQLPARHRQEGAEGAAGPVLHPGRHRAVRGGGVQPLRAAGQAGAKPAGGGARARDHGPRAGVHRAGPPAQAPGPGAGPGGAAHPHPRDPGGPDGQSPRGERGAGLPAGHPRKPRSPPSSRTGSGCSGRSTRTPSAAI